MAPRVKLPTSRGFTLADKRNQRLERFTLGIVVIVAVIAAAISFVALRWIGEYMGMGPIAPLLPLAIDGFGIICAFGIVRSQSMKETLRHRISEWVGLFYALAISVAGNVVHALNAIDKTFLPPVWLVVGFVSAVPVIVAYGVHLLGRAIDGGVSAHVLADNPDEITFDLRQLGESEPEAAAPARPVRKAAPATTPAPAKPTERPEAPAARALTVAGGEDPLKAAARAEFDRMVAAEPGVKPDASAIHRAIESPKNPATTRRWVGDWFEEYLTSTGATRPELDLPSSDEGKGDRATA